MATALFRHEGVDDRYVVTTPEVNTGVAVITVNVMGENHIVIDSGANQRLNPEDVDAASSAMEDSGVVLAVIEVPVETAASAMALAKAHGRVTVLNPAPAQPLSTSLLQRIDVLTPNERELRVFTGLASDDPADPLQLVR